MDSRHWGVPRVAPVQRAAGVDAGAGLAGVASHWVAKGTRSLPLSGLRDRVKSSLGVDKSGRARQRLVARATDAERAALRPEDWRQILAEVWDAEDGAWVLQRVRERPIFADHVVAFKALQLLHRVLQQGPPKVVTDWSYPNPVIDGLVAHWGAATRRGAGPHSQPEHCMQAVAEYAKVIGAKMELMAPRVEREIGRMSFKGNLCCNPRPIDPSDLLQALALLLNFSEKLIPLAFYLVAPASDIQGLDRSSQYIQLYIGAVAALLDESWFLLCAISGFVRDILSQVHAARQRWQQRPARNRPGGDASSEPRPPWMELSLHLLAAKPRFTWFHVSVHDVTAHCHQLRCAGFDELNIPKVPPGLLNLFADLDATVQGSKATRPIPKAKQPLSGANCGCGLEQHQIPRSLSSVSTAADISGPQFPSERDRLGVSGRPRCGSFVVQSPDEQRLPQSQQQRQQDSQALIPAGTAKSEPPRSWESIAWDSAAAWEPSPCVLDALRTVDSLQHTPLDFTSPCRSGASVVGGDGSGTTCVGGSEMCYGGSQHSPAGVSTSQGVQEVEGGASQSPKRGVEMGAAGSRNRSAPAPSRKRSGVCFAGASGSGAASKGAEAAGTRSCGGVKGVPPSHATKETLRRPGEVDAARRARRLVAPSPPPPVNWRLQWDASDESPPGSAGYEQLLDEDACSGGAVSSDATPPWAFKAQLLGGSPDAWSPSEAAEEHRAWPTGNLRGNSPSVMTLQAPSWAAAICQSNTPGRGDAQVHHQLHFVAPLWQHTEADSRSPVSGATPVAASFRGSESPVGDPSSILHPRPQPAAVVSPSEAAAARSGDGPYPSPTLPLNPFDLSATQLQLAMGAGQQRPPISPRRVDATVAATQLKLTQSLAQAPAAMERSPGPILLRQVSAEHPHGDSKEAPPRASSIQRKDAGCGSSPVSPASGQVEAQSCAAWRPHNGRMLPPPPQQVQQEVGHPQRRPLPNLAGRGGGMPMSDSLDASNAINAAACKVEAPPASTPGGQCTMGCSPIAPEWEVAPNEIRLESLLGSGSTAEVFRGSWHGTDVAVKRLRRSGSFCVEFTREISVLLRLRHPNLVLFMGASTQVAPPLIISEFCAGGTVFSLLHQRKELALLWSQRLKIAIDVAKGMNFLHRRQVIHRDLKSLNLLLAGVVTSREDSPQVKVSDFGLSRAFGGSDGQCQKQVCMTSGAGTYHWMAPEVLDGHSYDEKVDVYSYGICLYELIARRIPYDTTGLEPVSIAVAVSRGRRPDLVSLPRDCPADLRFTMECCWAQNPTGRPGFDTILETLKLASCI